MKQKKFQISENVLQYIINKTVKKVLNESNDFEGSEGLVKVLEKNGLNHTAARATEGAITYVAGIRNHNLLTKMAQYIQNAVDDNVEWTMRDRD